MIDSSAKVKLTLCVMQLQPNACRLHVVERYRRQVVLFKKIEHTVKAACLSASTVVSMLLCFEKFALVIPQ